MLKQTDKAYDIKYAAPLDALMWQTPLRKAFQARIMILRHTSSQSFARRGFELDVDTQDGNNFFAYSFIQVHKKIIYVSF